MIVAATDPQTAATFFSQYKQLNHGKVPPLITATDSLTPDYFNALEKVMGAAYVTKSVSLVGYHVNPNSAAFAAYKDGLTSSSSVPQAAVPVVTGIGVIASLYDGDIVAALAMTAAKSATGSDWNKAVLGVATGSGAKLGNDIAAARRASRAVRPRLRFSDQLAVSETGIAQPIGSRTGDRESTRGASVAERSGALFVEFGNEKLCGAMLVQLHCVGIERYAFGGADAGVWIDDHAYEHGGVLLGLGGRRVTERR